MPEAYNVPSANPLWRLSRDTSSPQVEKKRVLAKTDLAPDSFELGFSSWEGARKKCTLKDSVQKTFIAKWIPFRALGPAL
jgi:hypothetical protein